MNKFRIIFPLVLITIGALWVSAGKATTSQATASKASNSALPQKSGFYQMSLMRCQTSNGTEAPSNTHIPASFEVFFDPWSILNRPAEEKTKSAATVILEHRNTKTRLLAEGYMISDNQKKALAITYLFRDQAPQELQGTITIDASIQPLRAKLTLLSVSTDYDCISTDN